MKCTAARFARVWVATLAIFGMSCFPGISPALEAAGSVGQEAAPEQPSEQLTTVQPAALHDTLAAYVDNGDPTFSWKLLQSTPVSGQGMLYSLSLTSQTWQDLVWEHRLKLFVPARWENKDLALLYITGSGEDPAEQLYMAMLANATGAAVGILYDVPNQPIFGGLYEDAAIAYTFKRFLDTKDPTWPLLLPMTKSAVRAMDALQEFAQKQFRTPLKGFVVFGASKRGWTTWLVGAVDQRVKGIAPMVYNNLNLARQMQRQLEAFGSFSAQIGDYTALGLTDIASSPVGAALMAVVDPYTFRDQLLQPKLIIIGTNDPYWPTDALSIYYDELKGRNYILAIPNAGHGLSDYETLLTSIAAFYLDVAGKLRLPEIRWSYSEGQDGAELKVAEAPGIARVEFWIATSGSADFRWARWTQVQSVAKPPFTQKLNRLPGSWVGVFAQVTVGLGGQEATFSTPIFLLPDEATGQQTSQ